MVAPKQSLTVLVALLVVLPAAFPVLAVVGRGRDRRTVGGRGGPSDNVHERFTGRSAPGGNPRLRSRRSREERIDPISTSPSPSLSERPDTSRPGLSERCDASDAEETFKRR